MAKSKSRFSPKLRDITVEHESYGPESSMEEATNALSVSVWMGEATIIEWTYLPSVTDAEVEEGEEWLRTRAHVGLDRLLDPKERHRGAYSGDDPELGPEKILRMAPRDRSKAIVAAAISWMAHWGGEESYVSDIFEDD